MKVLGAIAIVIVLLFVACLVAAAALAKVIIPDEPTIRRVK